MSKIKNKRCVKALCSEGAERREEVDLACLPAPPNSELKELLLYDDRKELAISYWRGHITECSVCQDFLSSRFTLRHLAAKIKHTFSSSRI